MDSQMIAENEPKNKLKKKLRYSGIIAASFTLVQCVIWIILCIVGICCFYMDRIDTVTFDAFKYVYLNFKDEKQLPTVISPIIFNLICWFYLIGCNIWLFICIKLVQALYEWKNFFLIRKYLKVWILYTFSVCAIDLLFSTLFLVDFKLIEQRNTNFDKALYEFHASDTFDVSSEENLKEIKEIGNLERDIRNELKEYLLLKAHVKNHFMHGFLTTDANNDTYHNPFHKAVRKIKREMMDTRGRYNHVLIALNRMKSISENARNLEIPSAILMTIFLRGVIIWVINVFMASYMSYFYFC